MSLPRFWENLEWSVGEPLFPLGTISINEAGVKDEFSPLAISSQGWVYTFSDESRLVGQSSEKSLENLLAGELGEVVEWHEREQTRDIAAAIRKRIEERERSLLRGDWPQQETVLWKDNLAIADPVDFASIDWNAEAARVAMAFGISGPCRFVGPAIWRALILANNPDRREWEYQRPPISERLILRANYRPYALIFKIANSKLETLVVAEFSCGGYERADFNDYHRHYGKCDSEAALVLAKGLFHLGYLTPEIEAGLKVNISHHEKMEWRMAFESGASG